LFHDDARPRSPKPAGRCSFHYGDAIEAFRRISHPDQFHHAFLAASFAMMDNNIAAANHARSVLELDPAFCVDAYLRTLHYRLASDREHHRTALLKANLGLAPVWWTVESLGSEYLV
jgi:adenylate cyclase